MYIGTIPTPAATESRQEFTCTAGQTTFNTTGGTTGYIDCFLNGVKLDSRSDFTFDGSVVTLTTGAAAGDILAVTMRQADNALVALPIKDSAGNNVLSETNNVVSIDSGVEFPAGHVIQTKTSTLSSGFNHTIGNAGASTNNGGTEADGTAATRADSSWGGIVDDLIVTLTKSSSSSYFLITYNLYISNSRMAGAFNSYISLYSSVDNYADPISRGDVSGNRKRVTGGFRSYYDGNSTYDGYNNVHIGGQVKYSPSISSGTSVTIKPLVSSTYNIAVYLNFNSSDGDNIHNHRYVSTMTVQEIQGT